MSASTPGDIPQNVYYMRSAETVDAPAALSVEKCYSYLSITGTDAHTLAAPAFAGQFKHISVIAVASTPVSTVTVTGMRVATQNVFSGFGDFADALPKVLVLHSPDGVAWDIWTMLGVTVA